MKFENFKTFDEFWPFYLYEHSNPLNLKLHLVGTGLTITITIITLITGQWTALWAIPIVGYGLAWIGHFVIQKNRPATFKHPLWSLRGDFKMFFCFIRGQLNQEIKKHSPNPNKN